MHTPDSVIPGKALMTLLGFLDLGKPLKDLLKHMQAHGQINYISFGYDWRRNLDLSSTELLARVQQAYEETGEATTIIAHSMGGLVALHALARAPDPSVFKRILFCGTPFDDCLNILQPLRYGDNPALAKEVGNPAAGMFFKW